MIYVLQIYEIFMVGARKIITTEPSEIESYYQYQ